MTVPVEPSNTHVRPWQLYVTTAAFLAMALVYFLAFGGGSWHPTDYEYVPSQAWRLAHGEVPYRDFIYHKPPGTLFLHVAWNLFPDAWQVRGSRLVFYLQMVAVTLMPVLWALARGVVGFGWRLVLLTVATTAIALHNFPAMSWQTSDALFFASLGWVVGLESTRAEGRRALVLRTIASASLAFSLLCKQSFALACAAFGLWVLGALIRDVRRGRARQALALALASSLPAFAVLGAVFLWLFGAHAWPHYVAQFRSQSTGDALWGHLLDPYRGQNYLWVLIAWALVPLVRLWDGPGSPRSRILSGDAAGGATQHPPARREWRGWFVRLLAALPVLSGAMYLHQPDVPAIWRLGPYLMVALVGLTCGEGLVALSRWARGGAPPLPGLGLLHVGALGLALSCQLSLGYPTVILGIGIFGLLVHAALPQERSWGLDIAPALVSAALVGAAMWRANVDLPYRDFARPQQSADLGDVFVKLSGLRTSPPNHARYVALKRIVTEQILPTGRPFVALQDYPGVNWLFGARNPIGIDWCYPPEPDGFEERLVAELERTDPVAIVPKARDAGWRRSSFETGTPCMQVDFAAHNPISQYVVRHWRLIGEDAYFCLYRR